MRHYLLVLAMIAAFPAAASPIYRCTDAFGSGVSYQEAPCATAAGSATSIPTEFPDYAGPRDRLAAREAAADARLLERMRIESAERIARDDRAARQTQVEADRDRAQSTDAWIPAYVGPIQARPLHRARARPRTPAAH